MVSSPERSLRSSVPVNSSVTQGSERRSVDSSKVITMKQMKCVFLDKNYFTWMVWFFAFLQGYMLMDYVEGRISIIPCSSAEQQDQLILSWILTIIFPYIFPQVASFTTFAEVWNSLHHINSSGSEICLLHLQFQI